MSFKKGDRIMVSDLYACHGGFIEGYAEIYRESNTIGYWYITFLIGGQPIILHVEESRIMAEDEYWKDKK